MIPWILLLPVLLLVIFWSGPAQLKTDNSINTLERVKLGGTEQWISIRGANRTAPVLLFLHGGPGSANLAKLRLQTPELEQHFVVVNWDQRGAGKSFFAGVNSTPLTQQRLLSDAHELVQLLKVRFGVEKIYLMGFSWGAALGLSLADQWAEDFEAFICVNPPVNYQEGEKISLAYARQTATNAGNTQALNELASINPDYNTADWLSQLNTQRSWLLKFGGVYHTSNSYAHEMNMLFTASEYSLADKVLWPLGSRRSLEQMWPELMKINYFKQIPLVRCPIYFFVGRYDANDPWSLSQAYFEHLQAPAGKHLVWFEQSAHDIFRDEPDQLTQAILQILDD